MLSEHIREIRRAKGMTQEALAEAMGVSAASVSKWETEQSYPELPMLTALADFFEVSVDALLGHELKADRIHSMLNELESLGEEGRFEEGKALAEKLLRNYPNSYEAVDGVANLYYRIQVVTGEKEAMETSIKLVHRLFTLADGGEKQRLELMARLGNEYQLMGDHENARKYFEQANVSGCCARSLAYLQTDPAKKREAISENFMTELFYLILDAMELQELWEDAGEAEKAENALIWATAALESAGSNVVRHCRPAGTALHMKMAVREMERGNAEAAQKNIRRAAELVKGDDAVHEGDFLELKSTSVIASQELGDGAGLALLLEKMGSKDLIPVVEEVLG